MKPTVAAIYLGISGRAGTLPWGERKMLVGRACTETGLRERWLVQDSVEATTEMGESTRGMLSALCHSRRGKRGKQDAKSKLKIDAEINATLLERKG